MKYANGLPNLLNAITIALYVPGVSFFWYLVFSIYQELSLKSDTAGVKISNSDVENCHI